MYVSLLRTNVTFLSITGSEVGMTTGGRTSGIAATAGGTGTMAAGEIISLSESPPSPVARPIRFPPFIVINVIANIRAIAAIAIAQ